MMKKTLLAVACAGMCLADAWCAPCEWIAKDWADFSAAANWKGGRVPGAGDAVKAGRMLFDLGGKSFRFAETRHNGWEDVWDVGVRNGRLEIAKAYVTRSNRLCVEKGGELVFPKDSLWRGGDGMGDDRWEQVSVKAGGRLAIEGAFEPWHASLAVEEGGALTLAPQRADFSGTWFRSALVNRGTLDLPRGLTWTPGGRAGAVFEIVQEKGVLKLGAPCVAFRQGQDGDGAVRLTLRGGRVEASGHVSFADFASCVVAADAKIDLFIADKASFDLSPFVFGAGAKVVKSGPGTVICGGAKPPDALTVREGGVICLPERATKKESEITAPSAAMWQYEARPPQLTGDTRGIGRGLHGRATGLVRIDGANAVGDEAERRWSAVAWRNESVHGQFVVWTEAPAANLRTSVSPLVRDDGVAIPAEAVSTRFVRYVLGHTSRKGEVVVKEALCGDCLDDVATLDLPRRGFRPVWLTVRVPEGTAPGLYRGTLRVCANRADAVEFPLALTVTADTLTPPEKWPTFVDLWQSASAVARYHGVKPFSTLHYALLGPYLRELAKIGVRTITAPVVDRAWGQDNNFDLYAPLVEVIRRRDGSWKYDYSLFDEYVAFAKRCGLGPQIHCYTLAGLKSRYTDEATGERLLAASDRKAFWSAFLKDFEAHVKAKGWLGDVYLALDESEPKVLKEAADLLHAAAPGLKIAMAGNRRPSEYAGVTIDNYSQYIGHLTPDFLAEAKARKAKGMTTSYYICCGPGRPNTFLTSPLCESLWQGIYTAATGIDGLLRWAAFTWPRDPLFDASFGNWTPGDTFLLYPGPRASTRWEMLKDGFELCEKIRILRANGRATDELERLLDPAGFRDTAEFYAARTAAVVDEVDAICGSALLPVVPQPAEWKPSREKPFVPAAALRAGTAFPGVTFEKAKAGTFADEEYALAITEKGVTATAATETGFARAKATLQQLARAAATIPSGTVRDRPKYRLRGLMLDVARKPYSMAFLRAVAKTLAYYKMNVFHIHLNDGGATVFTGPERAVQGFRIESERYPGLASADQHYTKAEFRAFVKECAAMGVTVIPEFDSPAHCGAFGRYLGKLTPPQRFSIVTDYTNSVKFIEGLYDEYLSGDDPVFAGPYVHVGMDEFGANHIDAYRAYGRELFRIVRKYGKKVCVWGSSEHPDDPDGELLVDIWSASPGGYDPLKMMRHGWDTICTQGGMLYIVPAAGYYNDYLRVKYLYENWEPNVFGRDSKTEPGNPRLFGGKFAVWNDLSENGISEDDTFDRIFPAIQTLSQKMWTGTREDEDWKAFSRIAARLHEAPGVNVADRLTGPKGTPSGDDRAIGWTQDGGYTVAFEIRPQAGRTGTETLFDDGFTRVTLASDGRLGFTRDGLGHVFAAKLRDGQWTKVSFTGDADGVNLYVGGAFSESTKGLCKFCANWCNRGYSLYLRSPRTMHFPLVQRKFRGEIRNFTARTGCERRTLTLDADKYRGKDGVADVAKMAEIVNASGADEVTVLNARRDQPVEGGKQPHTGEASVLAFRCCMKGRYGTLTTGAWTTGPDGFEKTTATMSRRRAQ